MLVYRGAEQPDMSVINPESDVWQHVKVNYSLASLSWNIYTSSPGPRNIHGKELAIKILSAELRWKAHRCGWKEGIGTLQFNVWKVEDILGRETRTGVRSEGWDGVVPPCPHHSC